MDAPERSGRSGTRLTPQKTRYASTMENADFPDLAGESRDIWDQNARWWDARMGEGNDWHRLLIAPAVEKLLCVQPGERVLTPSAATRVAPAKATPVPLGFADAMPGDTVAICI